MVTKMKLRKLSVLAGLALLSTQSLAAWAHRPEVRGSTDGGASAELMKKIGIDQKMDSQVPLAAPFKDENGKAVTLAKYLGDKPVMLILISYTCTQICTAQFQALHPALSELPFAVGKDFRSE